MNDYQAIVKSAEEAVASVKNEKLKEIAFSHILSHLLGRGKLPALNRSSGRPQVRKKSATKPRGKKKLGTTAWLRDMAEKSFFKTPKNREAILEELESHSHHLKPSDVSWPLQSLCHDKVLRR